MVLVRTTKDSNYLMSQFTALAQAYVNYIQDTAQFKEVPLWKRQLHGYHSRPSKPVTLPLADSSTAHKALASLPKANYWALSFNLDTFDDFIEEIS